MKKDFAKELEELTEMMNKLEKQTKVMKSKSSDNVKITIPRPAVVSFSFFFLFFLVSLFNFEVK